MIRRLGQHPLMFTETSNRTKEVPLVEHPRRSLPLIQHPDRKQLRNRVLTARDFSDPLNDLRMLASDIPRLARIPRQVVKLPPRVSLVQVAAHALPVPDPHRLLASVTCELPVDKGVPLLRLAL